MRHIDALTSIIRLKDETELTCAFEKVKVCLSSLPVLKAPRRGVPFRLYVAAKDKIIGSVFDS